MICRQDENVSLAREHDSIEKVIFVGGRGNTVAIRFQKLNWKYAKRDNY